ncbi:hypothetical protein D3C72_1747630 [compost metagenome]
MRVLVVLQRHHGGHAQDVGRQHHLVLGLARGVADGDDEFERLLELFLGQLHLLDEGVQVARERVHHGAQARIGGALHGVERKAEHRIGGGGDVHLQSLQSFA